MCDRYVYMLLPLADIILSMMIIIITSYRSYIQPCYYMWLLCIYLVFCSTSSYSTPGSDHEVMTLPMTRSPFADAEGQCVPLCNHQPSSTVQWTPHSSAADYSVGSSSQFSQVSIHYFLVVFVYIYTEAFC